MSTETGTLPTCECKIIADGHGISGCPLHLAASKLFDALTNLANMAILLGKMQRVGMTVSPEMLEVLADHCKVARDALAQAKGEQRMPPKTESRD
jgi:hypothetical protein